MANIEFCKGLAKNKSFSIMLVLAMNQLFFLFLHILEPSFEAINNAAQQEHNNIHL